MNTSEKEIQATIKSLNIIWSKSKDFTNLKTYFHKNAIAFAGVDKTLISGQSSCAKHWVKCAQKNILSWKEHDWKINVFEDKFATVTYQFDIKLVRDGKIVLAKNKDMFSLIKSKDSWIIISAII